MAGRAWRVARILGIDVYIDSSWLLIFILVVWTLAFGYFPAAFPHWPLWQYWVIGIATALLFFVSVLLHELSHSVVARAQGEPVARITLFIFGGAAEITEEPKTAGKEFRMAVAGPVSSFVQAAVYAVLAALVGSRTPIGAMFHYLALINLGLGVFNLVPGFPLDGGRVLRSIVWGISHDLRRATRVASWAGQTVAFLLVFLGILFLLTGNWLNGLWFIFIGWFLRGAAISSYRQLVLRDAMADVRVSRLMSKEYAVASPDEKLEDLVETYVTRRTQHAYPVLDGDKLVGIICLHDIRKVPRDRWSTTTVREAMTPASKLLTVSPNDDGNALLARMASSDVHQLPVLENGQLVGMVTRSDVVHFLQWQTELGTYA
jgi:Zn-dependent protease/CBS domain-containing protein